MRKWSRFEVTVLSSLFRIEQRQHAILKGLSELLHEGPNDQELARQIQDLADSLNAGVEPLKAAVEENQ